jgi:tetratricopeptide (TPR) repeat protein
MHRRKSLGPHLEIARTLTESTGPFHTKKSEASRLPIFTQVSWNFQAMKFSRRIFVDPSSLTPRPLLLQAETALQKALSEDARNPFIHQLLASCYYNLASATRDEGDQESAASYSAKYVASLNRDYRDRSRIKWPVLRKEIEADFQLLVRKDYDEAIRLYRELADNLSANPLGTSQRAHWMLAGILAGDWGVAESATDIEQAREHLVDVLAHWPDSVPAQVIRHALRWNEETGENDFEHLALRACTADSARC